MRLLSLAGTTVRSLLLSAACCLGLTFLHAAQYLFPGGLVQLGVTARSPLGLIGIFTHPLLHAGTAHLASNLSVLFVLLFVLFSDERFEARRAIGATWIGSGVGYWLIGTSTAVGASGVVFGLITYLWAMALFLREWRPAFISVATLMLYGGVLRGVAPSAPWIAWEAHAAGALTGLWAAFAIHAEASGRAKALAAAAVLAVTLACGLVWHDFDARYERARRDEPTQRDRLGGESAGTPGSRSEYDRDHFFRAHVPGDWRPDTGPVEDDPAVRLAWSATGLSVRVTLRRDAGSLPDCSAWTGEPAGSGALDRLSRCEELEFHGRSAVRVEGSRSGDAASVASLTYLQGEALLRLEVVSSSGPAAARSALDVLLEGFRPFDRSIPKGSP